MPRIRTAEFRDANLDGPYPFADTATLRTLDGLQLAVDMFLDAAVYPIGGGPRLGLTSITTDRRVVTLTIGTPQNVELATATFDPLDIPDAVAIVDLYERPAGMLLCNPIQLAALQTWPLGTHRFAAGDAEFSATVTFPRPAEGLQGIQLADGEVLTGDIFLVGDDGIVVREDDEGHIRVDVVGDPLFARRLCSPASLFVTPNFLRTINGLTPTEYGEFRLTAGNTLAADTALRIYPVDAQTLKVEVVGTSVEGR